MSTASSPTQGKLVDRLAANEHFSPEEIERIANTMRHDIINMVEAGKSGHPGGSLSVTDILATLLFSGTLHLNPKDALDPNRDFLIMSKGHASPALYALFHQIGWVKDEELKTFRQLGTRLQGHPDRHALPGVEVCSGSLGQGLSIAVGAALGFRNDARQDAEERITTPTRRVFCVCGDGELQEGSNWEALMLAAHLKLANLTMILDLNNLQIDGDVRKINSLGDIDAKLTSFGWNVIHINGHQVPEILEALKTATAYSAGPTALVCDTVKGKGVSYMENNAGWHGKAPSHDEAILAREELDTQLEALKEV